MAKEAAQHKVVFGYLLSGKEKKNWVPAGFPVGSVWVPLALQCNIKWIPGGLRVVLLLSHVVCGFAVGCFEVDCKLTPYPPKKATRNNIKWGARGRFRQS